MNLPRNEAGLAAGRYTEDDLRSKKFDPTAFVAPAPNHYGTSGRGVLYAPGTQTVDVSLSRIWQLGCVARIVRLDARCRIAVVLVPLDALG